MCVCMYVTVSLLIKKKKNVCNCKSRQDDLNSLSVFNFDVDVTYLK